jgi:nitrogen fixation protein NifQ
MDGAGLGLATETPLELYQRLFLSGIGDVQDRHVLACAVVIATCEPRPLSLSLGLSAAQIAAVVAGYLPAAAGLLPGRYEAPLPEPDEGDTLEEPDLRRLLLDLRSRGAVEEEWLAAIIARRSQGANHLWQDLGLFERAELSAMMRRHFRPLAERNSRDMKWKKFFYRELCRMDGIVICKAPNCADCCDVALCFGDEAGEPLALLQRPAKG